MTIVHYTINRLWKSLPNPEFQGYYTKILVLLEKKKKDAGPMVTSKTGLTAVCVLSHYRYFRL